MATSRRLLTLFPALLLSACMVGPEFRPPEENVPSAWSELPGAGATAPSRAAPGPADLTTWWQALDDDALSALVERALAGNLDLKTAIERVREARAAVVVSDRSLLPGIDLGSSASRTGGAGVRGGGQDLFRAGLDASYEIDLFGRNRRTVEASEADLDATAFDVDAVRVSLVAEVASDYVALRAAQQRRAIVSANLTSQRATLDVTRRRQEGGFANALDVANAESQVASTESQLPSIDVAEKQAMHALSILTGEPPAALSAELVKAGPIPVAPATVPVGLPSDLLLRRPDVRAALARAHAATARLGVATADLYPSFSLTGTLGMASARLLDLLKSGTWSFGADGAYSLFDGGQTRAEIDAADAVRVETLLAYRSTVLGALRDVEDALVAFAKEQERREALTREVDADQRAVRLASDLYSGGETDYLNVLNAERQLLSSRSALVGSEQAVTTSLVALYKALGGGWRSRP